MAIIFSAIGGLIINPETTYARMGVDIYGNPTEVKARGRHDPCVLPRAVPIVEAMAALVVLDSLMLNSIIKC